MKVFRNSAIDYLSFLDMQKLLEKLDSTYRKSVRHRQGCDSFRKPLERERIGTKRGSFERNYKKFVLLLNSKFL